jgi:hypothetical protein
MRSDAPPRRVVGRYWWILILLSKALPARSDVYSDPSAGLPISAHVAQVAEHLLGKEKVPGSNPGVGSGSGFLSRSNAE